MNSQIKPVQEWEALAKEVNFKPSELADACGVSLRTLQRHFRKQYKVTVSGWLRMFRLRQAYSRLKTGESVKGVAYDLGYKQLSHFSRDFKNCYGVAPRFLQHSSVALSEQWRVKYEEEAITAVVST
jgi:AraC-like DNA-binding protein